MAGPIQRLRLRRLRRRLAGPRLLAAMARANPRAFFIEIGANDGAKHDPLREIVLAGEWRGIMVEPVPFVFERLRANYEGLGRVALENVAIADRDGELPFFHLRRPDPEELGLLPDWYDGTGSFSRATLLGHAAKIPDLERRIVATTVPCLSFESLCRRHAVESIDVLVIDAEGHDHEIVRSIDLEARRPRLLIYEHFHLAEDERAATLSLLAAHGYETMEEGFDTFALDARRVDAVSAVWRRLEPGVPGVSVADEAA